MPYPSPGPNVFSAEQERQMRENARVQRRGFTGEEATRGAAALANELYVREQATKPDFQHKDDIEAQELKNYRSTKQET